jgi:N-acetyl-anhydromuramyl-L-alanine amidase AmpD
VVGKLLQTFNTHKEDDKKDRYKAIIRVETLDCEPILQEFKKRGYDIESVLTVDSMEE